MTARLLAAASLAFALPAIALPLRPLSTQSPREGIAGGEIHAESRLIQVGLGRPIKSIAAAARMARSGDVVEIDAGEYVGGNATWRQDNLTIRGVGGRARIVQSAASKEEKALWMIKGDGVAIENVEFSGARVPDHNGAGIRHEGGKLTVRNCLFDDNEMGLLTWNDEKAELVVEASEFRDNAVHIPYERGGPIGHQIYVGTIARFTMRDSYVHHGNVGHLVKTRARESRIINSRITDEASGKASYEIEFPNGGIAYVIGNIVEQSASTGNPDIVSFGAEGYRWPRNELYVVSNTLIDDLPHDGQFIHVYNGADEVRVIDNVLLGAGNLDASAAWITGGNARATARDLPRMRQGDYRLDRSSRLVGTAIDSGAANGAALAPDREYARPLSSRALSAPVSSPGAVQTLLP